MEYVMVPVPEEIVDEVRAYINWGITTKTAAVEDPDVIATVVATADAHTRTLLRRVSIDALDDRYTTLREAAAAIGISTREVIGLVGEFNFDLFQAGGSPLTLVGKQDHRPIEDGVKAVDHKLLVVSRAVAEVIAEALDAD